MQSGKKKVKTVPTDLTYRNRSWRDNLKAYVREVFANMPRYEGTEAMVNVMYYKGDYYIGVATNSLAFSDEEEIVDVGCVPHISFLEGNACHGAGLPTAAMGSCEFSRQPLLVLGSWVGDYPKDKLSCGKGYPKGQQWISEPAPDWVANLNRLYGKKMVQQTVKVDGKTRRKWTVFNLIKISVPPKEVVKLRVEDVVSVIFSAFQTIPRNASIHMSEVLVNVDSGETVENVIARQGEKGGSGNVHRRIASYEEYVDRYCDKTYTIKCEPFRVEVADGLIATFEGAHLHVEVYPGLQKGGWMANLRDVPGVDESRQGSAKKGAGSGMGRLPTEKVGLFLPLIYRDIQTRDPDNAHSFARYQDNSIATYAHVEPLLRDVLGLQYRNLGTQDQNTYPQPVGKWANDPDFKDCRQKPALVVRIMLDGKAWLEEKASGVQKPYDAFTLLQHLQRRGDFYAENEWLSHEIIKAATKAARKNVPAELRHNCKELFPAKEDDFVKLYLDDRGGKKKHEVQGNPNYEIFDLDKPKSPVEEGKITFHTDSVRRFAVRLDGKWLSPSQAVIHPDRTRGVTLTGEFSDMVDQVPTVARRYKELFLNETESNDEHIPIFAVKICEMHRHEGDGKVFIEPNEYVHSGSNFPSRNIYLKVGKVNVHVGIVDEVPKAKGGSGGARVGTRVEDGKGNGRKAGGTEPWDYRCYLPEHLPFDYAEDIGRLKINMHHEFGKVYFNRPTQQGSKYSLIVENLYRRLNTHAAVLFRAVMLAKLTAIKVDELVRRYAINGDTKVTPEFYFLNFILGELLGEPWVSELTEKLDAEIGKQEKSKNEEEPAIKAQ